MKTTLISNENNEAKFTMDFSAEEFDKALDTAYKKDRGQFQINGFRRGKAPRSIIEKHYGPQIFFEDAIDDLFQNSYPDALDELDLEVVDRPDVDFSELKAGEPLTMTMTVAIYPTYEIKDYKGIAVDQTDVKVADESVDREIEALQKRNARIISVDRPAQDGDTVILDYAGTVDGTAFDGGTAESQELKLGSGTFIPGFEDQLIGAKKDEDVDVKVTFPENYGEKSLAGKDAVFACKIHEIKEEQLPDLDDEFAKDVSEFDTMDELREDTKKNLQENLTGQAKEAAKNQIVDKLVEASDIELRDSMIEMEIDNMLNELDQQLRMQGMTLDMYMQYMQMPAEDLRKNMREDAKKRATGRVIVRSIASQEGVEVTDEDVEEEIRKMAEAYDMEPDKMKEILTDQVKKDLRQEIQIRKTLDLLYDAADVTMVEPPKPEDEKPEEEAEDAKAEENAGAEDVKAEEAPAEDAPADAEEEKKEEE